jgi:hypothetical protein
MTGRDGKEKERLAVLHKLIATGSRLCLFPGVIVCGSIAHPE